MRNYNNVAQMRHFRGESGESHTCQAILWALFLLCVFPEIISLYFSDAHSEWRKQRNSAPTARHITFAALTIRLGLAHGDNR